ncbi:MAG: hypothetical protein AAFN93_17350, partial [Bacteroidota bacterium]
MKRVFRLPKLSALKQKNTRRLILLILIVGVIGPAIFFTYRHLIERRVNKFVVKTLVKVVEEEYGHKYRVEYEELGVNVWSSQISLSDIAIINARSDTSLTPQFEKLAYAAASTIYLDVDGLWRIWADDYLKINKLTLVSPDLEIVDNKTQKNNLSSQTGDLLKSVRRQLDLFRIDFLEIKKANLTIYKVVDSKKKLSIVLPDVSLTLSDFEWNTEDKLTAVTSDDFYISIKNQDFILPDSNYQLSFGELNYTLSDNKVQFEQLSIRNVKNDALSNQSSDEEWVDLNIPQFVISGTDFLKAYEENELLIDTISIVDPKVNWKRQPNNRRKRKRKIRRPKNVIYALASLFRSVRLGYFQLNNGVVEVELQNSNNQQSYKTGNIDIALTDLTIDSLDAENNLYNLQHKEMTLALNDITGSLPFGEHFVNIDRVLYSSNDKTIRLDSVEISPIDSLTSINDATIDFTIPKLAINNFDHLQVMNGVLDLSTLNMSDA